MEIEDLWEIHVTYGNYIRNRFQLWTGNESLLESCRVVSGKKDLDVDDASLVIIKALWMKMKEEDRLRLHED